MSLKYKPPKRGRIGTRSQDSDDRSQPGGSQQGSQGGAEGGSQDHLPGEWELALATKHKMITEGKELAKFIKQKERIEERKEWLSSLPTPLSMTRS